jgi:hypothetical protein
MATLRPTRIRAHAAARRQGVCVMVRQAALR